MENTKKTNAFVRAFKMYWGPLAALAVLLIILAVSTTTFMRVGNLMTVFRQICVNGLLAAGITCVLIVGCIDLSIGSTCAATGCLVVVMNSLWGMNVWLSIVLATLAGGLAGFINGFIRAKTLLPPFIITLAMQQTIRGFAFIFTNGYPITSTDKTFNGLGNGDWLGIPRPFYILVVCLIIVAVILGRTRLGRHMYAVGGNMEAAKHSGISYTRVVCWAYTICGLLAGLSGVIMASRMYSGQPTIGVDYGTDAIASAVIGGTAFGGGYGTIPGTFIGAVIIGVMTNGMNHLAINSYWQQIIKGLLILGAVYFDSVKGKMFTRKKKAAAK
jgi:ribose transport system permease protein